MSITPVMLPSSIWTIGGNVKDHVSLRVLQTDYRGYLDPKLNKDNDWFCVIETRLRPEVDLKIGRISHEMS